MEPALALQLPDDKRLHLEWFLASASDCRTLKEEMRYGEAGANAAAFLASGNAALASATLDSEELVVELVWTAVDDFMEAVKATRELDTEREAIALCRLGNVFTTCLKMPAKGVGFYKRSLELGLSLSPRVLDAEAWFVEARCAVQAWQRKIEASDAAVTQAAREPYLRQLSNELEALKLAQGKGESAFLDHVYGLHPPKDARSKRVVGADATLKSQYQKAIVHYHPDKNKGHGELWHVLAEEITKMLSVTYERLK
eukprot:jgi/Mesvir1/14410/Mv09796-RA.1